MNKVSEVIIYTKKDCPYCAAAKEHYNKEGITYTEIDVHDTPEAQDEVLKLTNGQRIVPVIVEDGRVTTGFGGG